MGRPGYTPVHVGSSGWPSMCSQTKAGGTMERWFLEQAKWWFEEDAVIKQGGPGSYTTEQDLKARVKQRATAEGHRFAQPTPSEFDKSSPCFCVVAGA